MDEREMMNALESLKGSVFREIRVLNQKPTLSPTEISAATDAMCLLMKIKKYEMGVDEFDDEQSYARGRSPVTGRYISRDMGYSGHNITNKMIEKLEMAYDDAHNQQEREAIRREIDHLRNMSN